MQLVNNTFCQKIRTFYRSITSCKKSYRLLFSVSLKSSRNRQNICRYWHDIFQQLFSSYKPVTRNQFDITVIISSSGVNPQHILHSLLLRNHISIQKSLECRHPLECAFSLVNQGNIFQVFKKFDWTTSDPMSSFSVEISVQIRYSLKCGNGCLCKLFNHFRGNDEAIIFFWYHLY